MSKYIIFGTILQCMLYSFVLAEYGKAQKISMEKINITVELNQLSIEESLEKLEEATGFAFAYKKNIINTRKRLDFDKQYISLANLLRNISRETGLNFRRVNEIIYVNRTKGKSDPKVTEDLVFKEKTITGKVTDENGYGLPGANIVAKGSNVGTVTDTDGNYKLNVPEETTTLVFSYVGYLSQEVQLINENVINVQLTPDIETLSEIVVIGYGTAKKKDLTGSISSISSDEITQLPVASFEQSMQGRMAGITVTQSGAPGGEAAVRIRGIGTIGDNSPLVVIDGVQTTGGLNSINPNDIESIDVLKDASATAIYGSRAANGVIILTTKRGSKNSETKITVSTYTAVQNAWKTLDVLNASEYGTIIRESRNNANAERAALGSSLLSLEPTFDNPGSLVSLTDWQDEIFRTGVTQDYQLGISGGNQKTNYAVSASFRDEKGIIINSYFKRYTFRASIDHNVSDKLSIGSTFNFSYKNSQGIPDNDIWNGVLTSAISIPEMFPVKDENGNYVAPTGGNSSVFGNSQNPVGQARREDSENPTQRTLGNIYAEYEIIDGLKLKTLAAIDLGTSTYKDFTSNFTEGSRPITVSTLNRSSTTSSWWTWDNTLSYSKVFDDHSITGLIGSSAQKVKTESFSASRAGFPEGNVEGLRFLDFGSALSQANNGSAGAFSLLSYFARASYSFRDKYLLNATVRRDGSSRFTKGNQWGTFPSVSIGWRISEEAFLSDVRWLSDLKLRGSWGEVGNQSVDSFYPYVTTVSPGVLYNTIFGNTLQPGVAPTRYGNKNLSWETTIMKNIGLDLSLLDNQVEFTADYFINDTEDMLLQVPLPQIIGQAEVPSVNAGSVRNKGLELSALYRNHGNRFTYSITANASFIKNEVTDLAQRDEIIADNDLRGSSSVSRTRVGGPIGSFFGYKTDGIFQSQAEVEAHAQQGERTSAGDIRFVDTNGDGVVNDEDRVLLGDGFPDVSYGLNFTAEYLGFDFALFIQGVSGVDVFNALEWLTLNNQGGNKTTEILDRWTPTNPTNDIPRLNWDDPNLNNRISDRYIKDGSYLRVKNIQIGYNFKKNLLESLNLDQLRIYLSSQNLFTFTDYNGFDPEIGGEDLTIGVDQGRYPQSRTFLLGINLTF